MLFDKVKRIVSKELNVDEEKITMDTNFVADLDADSLDSVELIMAIEDEFGIEVSDDDAQSIHTVGDLVNILEKNNIK